MTSPSPQKLQGEARIGQRTLRGDDEAWADVASWPKTNYARRFCKTNANRQYERTTKSKPSKGGWSGLSAEEKAVGKSGLAVGVRRALVVHHA
eukprot:682768-Alexandrium_andersonii.AAC.1